jgi:HEAT repeat protein
MKPASEAPRAPYKLFDYYTFADRDLFFGREEEVLRTVGEVLSTRLLVLFAPSGSGKSSLINAGVRPKLEERGFATATIRLDCAPDLAIKRQLRKQQEEKKLPECFAALKDDTDLVAGMRAAYAPKDGQPAPKPLVLFLDQFEEFFIVWRDKPEVRRAFIQQIARIKFDTSLPVYLVLSLRDDYFVNLNEFREEIPSIFHNNANIQLRPLDDAAALRAIVEPARICGLEFEPGLPEQIIRDLKALEREKATERGVHAASAPNSNGAASAEWKPEATEPGSGLKAALPDATDIGVLPITLQIVCHKLWEKRPAKGQPVTQKLYGGDQQGGGLGGAAAIIRRQLDESLQQIPRSEYGLMRKLFRVLMTADLTKRLRSIDDLAEILRLRDREKLKALLKNLTAVGVLREEQCAKQPWYEFRHDYLVKGVAAWLERFEARLRRRNRAIVWGFGVVPALVLAGLALWNFLSLEVRLAPTQYQGQEEELYVTRRFNPFGFYVTTGFRMDEVTDYEARNAVLHGFPLRFARPQDWRPMTNLLSRFNAARLSFISDPQPGSYVNLVTSIQGGFFGELGEVDTANVAVAALFARKDESLLSPLLLCLQSTNAAERLRGAAVLAQLGNTNAPVVAGLLSLIKDSNYHVSTWAAEALSQLGKGNAPMVEDLFALLKGNDKHASRSAAMALGKLGQGDALVVGGLLALLEDSNTGVRLGAAISLSQLRQGSAPILNGLLALLKDSDKNARQVAAVVLGGLGRGDVSVVNGLLFALKDSECSVRQSAADALGQLGQADTPVVEGLLALLKDSDPICGSYVRQGAAGALVQLGLGDAPVVEALLALLKDNNPFVRMRAEAVLVQLGLGDKSAVETLLVLLKGSNPFVRQSAAAVLVQLGQGNAQVVDTLLALLKDSNSHVRVRAAAVLVQSGQGDALVVEDLLASLKESNQNVNERAAEVLGRLGQQRPDWTDERLLQMLQDNLSGWRQTAADGGPGAGQSHESHPSHLRPSHGPPPRLAPLGPPRCLGRPAGNPASPRRPRASRPSRPESPVRRARQIAAALAPRVLRQMAKPCLSVSFPTASVTAADGRRNQAQNS